MTTARKYGTDSHEWLLVPTGDDDDMVLLTHPDGEVEDCVDMDDALERTRMSIESFAVGLYDDGETMAYRMLQDALGDIPDA